MDEKIKKAKYQLDNIESDQADVTQMIHCINVMISDILYYDFRSLKTDSPNFEINYRLGIDKLSVALYSLQRLEKDSEKISESIAKMEIWKG